MKSEDIQHLKNYEELIQKRIKPKGKKYNPTRIRLKSSGEYFVTEGGKTLWNNVGPAKAALRLDFPSVFVYDWRANTYFHRITKKVVADYNEREKIAEETFQEFVKNWVEFIPA